MQKVQNYIGVKFVCRTSPQYSVSDFVGYLKGKSALMIFDKHPYPLQVKSPYRAVFKPPLEEVVLTCLDWWEKLLRK